MVTVRYWAGARAAAGRAEENVRAATVGELLASINARPGLARIVASCSLLIDGAGVHRDETSRVLPPGATVDVLPPFTGG
jgi:molybdopterin synthase sulfur carrier subunit